MSKMFEPNSNLPPATITDGVYQIDACPRSFEVVLNWLRYRTLIIGDTKVDDVFPVADYFGLRDLRDLLENHKEKEAEEKGKLITCIEDSVEKIEEVLQHVECEISAINEKMEDFKIEVRFHKVSFSYLIDFLSCLFRCRPWLQEWMMFGD